MKTLLELYKSIYNEPVSHCFVINTFDDFMPAKQLQSDKKKTTKKKKIVGLGFSQLID